MSTVLSCSDMSGVQESEWVSMPMLAKALARPSTSRSQINGQLKEVEQENTGRGGGEMQGGEGED